MLALIKSYLTWPIVALFGVAGACVTVVLVWGPPEAQAKLIAGIGWIASLVALEISRAKAAPP
mgnify:CR=1 FL=1